MNHNSAKMVPVSRAFTTSSLAEYREGVGTLRANGGDLGGGSETLIAKTLTAGIGQRYDFESDTFAITFGAQMSTPQTDVDMVQTLQAKNPMAVAQPVAYPMHGGMIGRQEQNGPGGSGFGDADEPSYTLTAGQQVRHGVVTTTQSLAFDSFNLCETGDITQTIKSPQGGVTESVGAVLTAMQVRRLTPVECERLQGFPDGYTNIPWRKATESPDGPRYKALGNSMAVPVMAWIGKRIQQVSGL